MSSLKVVRKFSFPHEANIAKINLESVGINSHIADEHTINMQWLYSDAMGGVRLMVSEADFDAAMEILNSDEPIIICDEAFDNIDDDEDSSSLPSSSSRRNPVVIFGFNFIKWCCVLLVLRAFYYSVIASLDSQYLDSLIIFLYFGVVPLIFVYMLHKYHRK